MNISTHRLIQFHTFAERTYSEAGACRRGSCNAANANIRGAARMLSARASTAFYLSAMRRMGTHAYRFT